MNDTPVEDHRLFVACYSCALPEDAPAGSQQISAIAVQQVVTGRQSVFASIHEAEARGWKSRSDFLAHLGELERLILGQFYAFVGERPDAVWLHWNMSSPTYGFDAIAHRARLCDVAAVPVPDDRLFDLANYLQRRHGPDYVGHPRFLKLVQLNGLDGGRLLEKEAAAAAWREGRYADLVRSMQDKAGAIASLYRLTVDGRLKVGSAAPASQTVIHNADFTMVNWFGREYSFALEVQAPVVEALWEEWERSGLGLHQQTIREAIDKERDTFRMDTAFRKHPAFGTMIQRCGDGRYRLVPPG
jgi:hypothetical protein